MADQVKMSRKQIRALLNSPEVRADLTARAARVASRAEATAPRDTGALAASHVVETDVTPVGRFRARVVAKTPYAAIVAAKDGYLGAALDAGSG